MVNNTLNSTKKVYSNFIIVSLLFLIYPLLAIPFIFTLIKTNARYAYLYLSIFMGYVGMLYPPVGDYYRYVQDFGIYSTLSFSELSLFFAIKTDFIMPIFFWVLGKVGCDPGITRFLYNFIGYYLIFSIFHSITNNSTYNDNGKRFFLFILLMLYVSFRLFLSRFGLSTILFVYGIHRIYSNGKYGWFFILLSACHHFSFAVLFLLVFVARNINFQGSKRLTLTLLIISLVFVSDVISPVLNALSGSSMIIDHIFYYVDGYYANEYYEDHSLKFRLMTLFSRLAYFVPLLYFYINFEKSRMAGLINCLMLLLVIVAPFKGITGRFEGVTQMILLIYMIRHFYHNIVVHRRLLRKIVLITGVFICFVNIWGSRRELSISNENKLLLPTYYIVTSTYTEDWLGTHVDDKGAPILDF